MTLGERGTETDRMELVEGQPYHIELNEAEIDFAFEARFLGYMPNDRHEDEVYAKASGWTRWSNGVTLGPVWGGRWRAVPLRERARAERR